LGFIRYVARAAARAGLPVCGKTAGGNTRAARDVIARNCPPGASNTIALPGGPFGCCAWAPLPIAAPCAAAISRASGPAESASPGDPARIVLKPTHHFVLKGHQPKRSLAKAPKSNPKNRWENAGERRSRWAKIEMVPSDPLVSSSPGRYTRPGLGICNCVA